MTRTQLTEEEIKSRCEQVGLKYVRHWRKNGKIYVEVFCKCGEIFSPSLNGITTAIKQGKEFTCVECGLKRTTDSKRSEESRKNMSEKMKGNTHSLGFKHTEETRAKMSESHKGKPISEECRRKAVEASTGRQHTDEERKKMSERRKGKCLGANNPKYNPNLTDEDRVKRRYVRGYKEWEQEVKRRANYTCDICGKYNGSHCSHHLDGWNWCKEKRLDINNGVCLCKHCHEEFHGEFGSGDNTKEQYNKFKKMKQEENTSKTA